MTLCRGSVLVVLMVAGSLNLTDIVMGIASLHAGGRVISVLEGGYSLDGLQQAVNAHLDRLTA